MIEQLAAEYQERRAAGLSQEEMLSELHRHGVDYIDAIKVVRLTDGASLSEAYAAVTSHPAWRAGRTQTRRFTVGIPVAMPLPDVAAAASSALGLSFRERDSPFYGGRYFRADMAGTEEILVYRNYDAQAREPFDIHATDCSALVEFSGTLRDPTDNARLLSAAFGVACRVVWPLGQDAAIRQQQRDTLARAAEAAADEYITNKELTDFEAFGEDDLFDEPE